MIDDFLKVGTNPNENNITKLEKASSERELLSLFLTKIQKMDPDVIIGHDIMGFDLEVLVHRMSVNKIAHWSRLGRLRRSQNPGARHASKDATIGRLVCDLKISAKELIRCKSYELGALVEKVLREGRSLFFTIVLKIMYFFYLKQIVLHSITLFHFKTLECK